MDFDGFKRALDTKKRISKRTGVEYWMARDIQPILGYETWQRFEQVIERAKKACESVGDDPAHHIRETANVIAAGKGAQLQRKDYFLARSGCYLIAMNGDPSKPEIGMAQAYFAVQTHRQEQFDQLTEEEKRLALRRRVSDANEALNHAASQAGVVNFAIFHSEGYKGLYGMNLGAIKRRKGIPTKDKLLDRAGRAELAANEFRITQTEERLATEVVTTEDVANKTHFEVGLEVRKTIERLGGTLPENMKAEPHIRAIEKKLKDRKELPPASQEG